MDHPVAYPKEGNAEHDSPKPEADRLYSKLDENHEGTKLHDALDENDEPSKRFEESFLHTTIYEEQLDSLRMKLRELDAGHGSDRSAKRSELKRRIRACQKLVDTERKILELWKGQIRNSHFADAFKNNIAPSDCLLVKENASETNIHSFEITCKHDIDDRDSDASFIMTQALKHNVTAKNQTIDHEVIKKAEHLQKKKGHRGKRGGKKRKSHRILEASGLVTKNVNRDETKTPYLPL